MMWKTLIDVENAILSFMKQSEDGIFCSDDFESIDANCYMIEGALEMLVEEGKIRRLAYRDIWGLVKSAARGTDKKIIK